MPTLGRNQEIREAQKIGVTVVSLRVGSFLKNIRRIPPSINQRPVTHRLIKSHGVPERRRTGTGGASLGILDTQDHYDVLLAVDDSGMHVLPLRYAEAVTFPLVYEHTKSRVLWLREVTIT